MHALREKLGLMETVFGYYSKFRADLNKTLQAEFFTKQR